MDAKIAIPAQGAAGLASAIYAVNTLSGTDVVAQFISNDVVLTIYGLVIFSLAVITLISAGKWAGDQL